MRTLFISFSKQGQKHFTNDASTRYRCLLPAEHLSYLGICAHVIHYDEYSSAIAKDYGAIIFHRPRFSNKLNKQVSHLKKQNKYIAADFDDFLFDTDEALQMPAYLSQQISEREAIRQASCYQKALALFEHCWVSTQALAAQVNRLYPHITTTLCYNKLPERWKYLTPRISADKKLEKKIIRYFSGTSHHKHDFKVIEKQLSILLHEHSDISLEIVGSLNINIELFPEKQIVLRKSVIFEELPKLIASSWLTIAPLSQSNAFNYCKSGLKFWESGLYKVPALATPNADMIRACSNTTGACLSNNWNEWQSYIINNKDKQTYQQNCDNAYKAAKESLFTTEEPRLQALGLSEPKTIKSGNKSDYALKQQILYYLYGHYWIAKALHPSTSKSLKIPDIKQLDYMPISELAKLLPQQLKSLDNDSLLLKLNALNADKLKAYKAPHNKTFLRRLKKLIRSPRLFFNDSKHSLFRFIGRVFFK